MEARRKSMRVLLLLCKLRELLDESYVDDMLEQLIVYRHPRTSLILRVSRVEVARRCHWTVWSLSSACIANSGFC